MSIINLVFINSWSHPYISAKSPLQPKPMNVSHGNLEKKKKEIPNQSSNSNLLAKYNLEIKF